MSATRTRTDCIVGIPLLAAALAGCTRPEAPPSLTAAAEAPPSAPAMVAAAQATSRPLAAAPAEALPASPALNDYLRAAALNNEELRSSLEAWKAALERVPQVKALPDPQLTYRYYVEKMHMGMGALRQEFELGQMFPWFGKLELRGDAAAEEARAEAEKLQAVRLRLFQRVKDAYHEYAYLAAAVTITRENLRLLQSMEGVARIRYKAAAGGHPDVIRAQVELGKLDNELRTMEDMRPVLSARLNAAMDRPAGEMLPWPEVPGAPRGEVDETDLLGVLEKENPELKAMDHQIARAKVGIALARKDYFPDVMVGVGYMDMTMRSGADERDPLAAMVSVNLPVWWEKLSAGVREAQHRHLAVLHRRAEMANALGSELKMVLYRCRDARRRAGLYRDTLLPKATESYKASEAAYRAGTGSFQDLLDSQRVLLEFQLAARRAMADQAQRLAEIEMLVGKELSAKARE